MATTIIPTFIRAMRRIMVDGSADSSAAVMATDRTVHRPGTHRTAMHMADQRAAALALPATEASDATHVDRAARQLAQDRRIARPALSHRRRRALLGRKHLLQFYLGR